MDDLDRSDSSVWEVLKGALILPFSPLRGFTALHHNASILSAVLVGIAFPMIWGLASMVNGGWVHPPGQSLVVYFARSSVHAILFLLLLVVFSAVFVRRGPKTRADYASNARLIGYWYAWQFSLTSVGGLVWHDGHFQLIFGLLLFAWFAWLLAVALSVANDVALRRCLIPGICALFCSAVVSSWLGLLGWFAPF